jgi:hypothetical protein
MGDKQKKKLTKKEQKAANHAKLMSNKGHNSNVVEIKAFKEQQEQLKKAS